jgi:hypothetical protein
MRTTTRRQLEMLGLSAAGYDRDGSFGSRLRSSCNVTGCRELGVPRYAEFRRLLHLPVPKTFDDVTSNKAWAAELAEVYGGDIDSLDVVTGMYAEDRPEGFAFSDTAFRIFILMASRRLNSDRFFTTHWDR